MALPHLSAHLPEETNGTSKPLNKIDFIHHQVTVINQQARDKAILKIRRSYFHLRSHGGVVGSLPRIPVDAFSAFRVSTVMIETIQV